MQLINNAAIVILSGGDRFGLNRSTQSKDPYRSTNCIRQEDARTPSFRHLISL
jgi:hypothetical protein